MATIALAAGVSAAGGAGAIGGALGIGAIGGALAVAGAGIGAAYIDQRYVYPALFPSKDATAPRLGNQQLQTATEGAPVNYCLGPTNRMAGTVIWMSDLIETSHKEKVGGKGGGGQSVKTYSYSAHVAIAVCEGPIMAFKKIWADGKLIYSDTVDISIIDDTISCTVREIEAYIPVTGGYKTEVTMTVMTITSPDGGPDLSQFRSGKDVVVSGWANANNNGTFRCTKSILNDDGTSEAELLMAMGEVFGAADEGAGASVTLEQDLNEVDDSVADDITFHLGSSAQTADTLIDSLEDDVPGFRGIAYAVFNNLQLVDFGNRIPQFAFLIEAATAPKTVAASVGDLIERAGRSSGEYDAAGISGNLRGMGISGPQSMRNALGPLMLAFDIVVNESAGVLTFKHRGDVDSDTVNADDLAAHEEGADVPRVASIVDGMGCDLPGEVDVQFMESTLDYLQGSQRERRIDISTNTIVRLNLPIVLTPGEARAIARRELWTPWANRQVIRISLPPSYLHYQENDKISVAIEGESYQILIKRIDRGANHLINIEGILEEVQTLTQGEDSESPIVFTPEFYVPPELIFEFIDIAPFRSEEVLTPGFYHGACSFEPSVSWPGGTLYISDDDTNFAKLCTIPDETVIGETTTALEDANPGYWDLINTVTVVLKEGTLSSATESQVLNGANRALIGDEVIAFQTATLTDTRTYTLTNLIRGLRNTERFTANHNTRERFVLLTDGGLQFEPVGVAAIGRTKYFRAASRGAEVANLNSFEKILQGNTIRPFAPCHVKGFRDATENLTIDWVRRSRAITRPFSEEAAPLLEEKEEYEIDVLGVSTTWNDISIHAIDNSFRSALGDFGAVGFTVGNKIKVSGCSNAQNNGTFTIASVLLGKITIEEDVLIDESAGNNITITEVVRIIEVSDATEASYSATEQTIDFGSNQSSVHIHLYQISSTVGRGHEKEATI